MTDIKNSKLNNVGYTLIELIVVIAIMSILVGGAGLGVSLVYSKDATNCATKINDAIYKTRMESMSKAGDFELKIDNTGTANIATISCSNVTPAVDDTIFYLDDVQTSKKTNITAKFITESDPAGQSISLPVVLEFDKAKGNVDFDANGDGTPDDGIIIFEIKPTRGNRESKVQIVTSTGKHTIGDF